MPTLDKSKYRETDMFSVEGTIPTPHPYCITPRLVAYTSDNHRGILGESAIEDAESKGIICDICRQGRKDGHKVLSYKEHETAILIAVNHSGELKEIEEELREYLLSIKDQTEADGFAGFAFKQVA